MGQSLNRLATSQDAVLSLGLGAAGGIAKLLVVFLHLLCCLFLLFRPWKFDVYSLDGGLLSFLAF